jgi:type II secretory pathway pseudopilin PulG
MRVGKRLNRPTPQRGYVLVLMMFALALFGVGLATVGEWASEIAHRDREAALLRTGGDVIEAIRSYYRNSPGTAHRLPTDWSDLLEDRRFVGTVRHLRSVPRDPFTNERDWVVIRDANGAMIGFRSTSDRTPLAQLPIDVAGFTLAPAARYSDWRFVYDPASDTVVLGVPLSGLK